MSTLITVFQVAVDSFPPYDPYTSPSVGSTLVIVFGFVLFFLFLGLTAIKSARG